METKAARREELRQVLAMVMLDRRLKKLAGGSSPRFLDAEAAGETIVRAFHGRRLAIACKTDDWRTALSAAEQELRRAAQFGFNETEFREVKQMFVQIMENTARQAGTRLSPELADGIVKSLAQGEVFSDPAEDLAIFNEMLGKVTLEDCARCCGGAGVRTTFPFSCMATCRSRTASARSRTYTRRAGKRPSNRPNPTSS